MGDTVNFRSHNESYKDKTRILNPKEDWLIFEDTHEAIVDRETWKLAQKLRKTPKRIDTFGVANPLTGLLYCADCGEKMYNHRTRGNPEKRKYPADFFDCSTYTLAYQKRFKACSGHYITTKALNTLIFGTIRTASTYAVANQEEFLEKVRAASQVRQQDAAKETKRKLNKDRKRRDELDGIIKKLYESYAVGRISEERFDSLLADYEMEQQALDVSVTEAEAQLASFEEDTARAEQFLALAKKYTDFSELTTPMINEFIDKIIVHAPEKVDGDRTQRVDIYLNFIGCFEVPPPEPTPEELKREAQLKRQRMKSRERYQQLKSGECVVGQPYTHSCKCCGKTFESKNSNAIFCGPNCILRQFGTTVEDDVIEEVLRTGAADIGQKYLDAISAAATKYVSGIMRRLREHEYNPELIKLYVMGGGSCMIKHLGTYDPERVTINEDICATAKGYETLARLRLKQNGGIV